MLGWDLALTIPYSPMCPAFWGGSRLLAAEREKYFVANFNLQECMERAYTEMSLGGMLAMSKTMMLYYLDNYLSGGLVSAL